METRETKAAAARITGISRKTITVWAKSGQISEGGDRRQVLVTEVRENWEKLVEGRGKRNGKPYSFHRAKACPGKPSRVRRVYRAPVQEIDQAAIMENEEGGIDFKRVKAAYDRLRIFGDEFFARIKLGRDRGGYRERLDLVVNRQKVLRSLARKKIRNERITDCDKAKAARLLKNASAGLGNLASPSFRELALFDGRYGDQMDEYLEELMEKRGITWREQCEAGKVDFGEVNPMSSFSHFWKWVQLAPDLVCHKFLFSYARDMLDLEMDEERPTFDSLGRQMGISAQAVMKRFTTGVERIAQSDPELARKLENYVLGAQYAPAPTSQEPENDESRALKQERQGSLQHLAVDGR